MFTTKTNNPTGLHEHLLLIGFVCDFVCALKKIPKKKKLFHLILIEECGEEAEECEGGQHGHGVGAEGIGPRQGRVHFLSVSIAPLAI